MCLHICVYSAHTHTRVGTHTLLLWVLQTCQGSWLDLGERRLTAQRFRFAEHGWFLQLLSDRPHAPSVRFPMPGKPQHHQILVMELMASLSLSEDLFRERRVPLSCLQSPGMGFSHFPVHKQLSCPSSALGIQKQPQTSHKGKIQWKEASVTSGKDRRLLKAEGLLMEQSGKKWRTFYTVERTGPQSCFSLITV